MTDHLPRYYAISGFGYGRGDTPGEAIEQYVSAQLRSFPAKSTRFGTPKKWEAALRTGEAKAVVWLAPEGTTGFVLESGSVRWLSNDANDKTIYTEARAEERLDKSPEFLEQLAAYDRANPTTISKTEFVYTVLHRTDEPFSDGYDAGYGEDSPFCGSLAEAMQRSYDGNAVGAETSEVTTPVQNHQVERELVALGNDGEFFDSDLTVGA